MLTPAAAVAVNNTLSGQPGAVDVLYRAASKKEFSGESPNLAWSRARGGMVLSPTPGSNAGDRRRASRSQPFRGVYTSPVVGADFPFNEVIPSWNILLDEETQGYRVFMRVAGAKGRWSKWFYFGGAGTLAGPEKIREWRSSEDWGRVNTDYIALAKPATRFQYRVELESNAAMRPAGKKAVVLRRFFVAYANSDGSSGTLARKAEATPTEGWARDLNLPYRSQMWVEDKRLAGRICCPTSLAMVLQAHGHDMPTTVVADLNRDSETRIYGNWSRTTQTGSQFGFEAWVQRFRSHDDVKRLIAQGVPILASIRFRDGALSNAHYKSTNGHIILVRGMTADGDYIVNDPYNPGPDGKEVVYLQSDMQKVWFDKGGVGMVMKPEEKAR